MKTITAAIVTFEKPFFTYNKEGVKQYPTIVELGSGSTSALMIGDSYFEADTIVEVMVEFDRLGFKMPDESVWDFPERSLRVTVKDLMLLEMLKRFPELISFLDSLKEFIVVRNGCQIIYLNELFEQHKELFTSFGASVENNE